ncbi:MAG: uroporphyrinogen-III synthase [Bacteroidales bacterium]
MKIKKILISQPAPANGSPYADLIAKHKVDIDFIPFFTVEPVHSKEFRLQKINIPEFTAIVFTSRTTIDVFFNLCEELRIAIPESMKYFCISEAIALYLQKHIIYRKRKIFFGNGTPASILEAIGVKHKSENFLLTVADNYRSDINRQFAKAKLKHSSAILVKTVSCDLSNLDITQYNIVVFYSPSDVKSLKKNYPNFTQGNLEFATFGPATLKALKAAKLVSNIKAPTPEAPSIAKALSLYFEQK